MCLLFGVSRQAYYQHYWQEEQKSFEETLIVKEVMRIRQSHRRLGGRKLYEMLEPFMLEHQIKMGRDALFDVLASNRLLIKKRKRKVHTTQSFHWLRKYPNLIRDFKPHRPNQLWVSDITYWKIGEDFLYISFVTDAYSKMIVGYHVAETLESIETLKALQMAISYATSTSDLIHHSDRGIQYCSSNYVKVLQDNGIAISMTESGDPLENPIAERVNGIIKEEYLEPYQVSDLNRAKQLLKKIVKLYNDERPHMSIGNLTPNKVHHQSLKTQQLW